MFQIQIHLPPISKWFQHFTSVFDKIPSLTCFTSRVYTNLDCSKYMATLKCLFRQNRFLHDMPLFQQNSSTFSSSAWPSLNRTLFSSSSSFSFLSGKADLVPNDVWLWGVPGTLAIQIRIQIQIHMRIKNQHPHPHFRVKRLTWDLTTFDYGEDQAHWQSHWHPQPNWERPANMRTMFQRFKSRYENIAFNPKATGEKYLRYRGLGASLRNICTLFSLHSIYLHNMPAQISKFSLVGGWCLFGTRKLFLYF